MSAGNRYRQEHRVTARQHRLDDLGGGWFPGPVDVAAHGGTVGNVRQNALDEVRARRCDLRAPRADLRAQLGLAAMGATLNPPAVDQRRGFSRTDRQVCVHAVVVSTGHAKSAASSSVVAAIA